MGRRDVDHAVSFFLGGRHFLASEKRSRDDRL